MSYRGVRCPICMTMQDYAELVHAKFTHALRLYAKILFVCGRVGRFGVPLKPGQNRIHFRD